MVASKRTEEIEGYVGYGEVVFSVITQPGVSSCAAGENERGGEPLSDPDEFDRGDNDSGDAIDVGDNGQNGGEAMVEISVLLEIGLLPLVIVLSVGSGMASSRVRLVGRVATASSKVGGYNRKEVIGVLV